MTWKMIGRWVRENWAWLGFFGVAAIVVWRLWPRTKSRIDIIDIPVITGSPKHEDTRETDPTPATEAIADYESG